MNQKLNYLNVGCGNKYHKDWVNIDMNSNSPGVISCNLLKGIPFPDEQFEVVYHSNVLEHFPKEKAFPFVQECYRVLKKNGTIRVVVPDLENIVDEYKAQLQKNLENPSIESEANYDWILLELFDQTVRNQYGGQMALYLQQQNMVNKKFITERIGHADRVVQKRTLLGSNGSLKSNLHQIGFVGLIKKVLRIVKQFIINTCMGEAFKTGVFRLSGEVHMWMYDRYSIVRLLKSVGFKDIQIKNPFNSDIAGWNEYELDVKDGLAYEPVSLFVEAKK